MQETIFIIVLVAFVVYILYQRKKRKEQQMKSDLEYYIEQEDWAAVSRIFLKQLVFWGAIFVLTLLLIGCQYFSEGEFSIANGILCLGFGWQVFNLSKSYYNSRQNERNARLSAEYSAFVEDRIASLQTARPRLLQVVPPRPFHR